WSWGIVLIVFFLASTGVSHIGRQAKHSTPGDIVQKTGARDAWQVTANGAPFAVAALASIVWPWHAWHVVGAGAIAASSADTWATEMGMLSRQAPHSVIDWKRVPAGTSGGVTPLGIGAAIAGSALVAGVTFLAAWGSVAACGALTGGLAGSIADSILGATIQTKRRCPLCGTSTERVVHSCGTTTEITGGIRWLDNDGVNLLSSVIGAAAGTACLT
ncbi:MAG TPA: DUF92 domain-containing protein, partial [Gemmatimonadaceae bacterium]|nr:DUF92 domain-containing protein [Gemmatimonadaceae bacterium]